MKKHPELHPLEKKYFENLFHASEHFKNKVQNLREKHGIKTDLETWKLTEPLYSDTMQFFRWDERIAEDMSKDDYIKWKSFDDDTMELAQYFYLQNYFQYFKNYIIGRWFEPLLSQKILWCDKDWMTLQIPYQISKKEFVDIWRDIETMKNTAFWKKAIDQSKVQKIYKKDLYFDDKFFYYKQSKEWWELPDYLKSKFIDESNKTTWITEIAKVQNLLVIENEI